MGLFRNKKKDTEAYLRSEAERLSDAEWIVDMEEALFDILDNIEDGDLERVVGEERAKQILKRFGYLLNNGPSKIHYVNK